jgi:hypothetical protein
MNRQTTKIKITYALCFTLAFNLLSLASELCEPADLSSEALAQEEALAKAGLPMTYDPSPMT